MYLETAKDLKTVINASKVKMYLDTAKDLKTVILPFEVNCLMRHNFKMFSILKVLSCSRFYYVKNGHQVFSQFCY